MPTKASTQAKYSPGRDTATLTSDPITVSTGDVVIVKIATEDPPLVINAPTCSGQTLQLIGQSSVAGNCPVAIYAMTIVGSPTTVTVVCTFGGTVRYHMAVFNCWTSAVLAATPATNATKNGSGAPSATLTTTAANSAIDCINGDWNARAPGTPTYKLSAINDGLHNQSTNFYVGYGFYSSDVGAAGAKTIGMNTPNTQAWGMIGVEIKHQAAGSPNLLAGSGGAAGGGSGALSRTRRLSGTGGAAGAGQGAVAVRRGLVSTTGGAGHGAGLLGRLVGLAGGGGAAGSGSAGLGRLLGMGGVGAGAAAGGAGGMAVRLGLVGAAGAAGAGAGGLGLLVALAGGGGGAGHGTASMAAQRPLGGAGGGAGAGTGDIEVSAGLVLAGAGGAAGSGAGGVLSTVRSLVGTAGAAGAGTGSLVRVSPLAGSGGGAGDGWGALAGGGIDVEPDAEPGERLITFSVSPGSQVVSVVVGPGSVVE